jgi:hypothetical protein
VENKVSGALLSTQLRGFQSKGREGKKNLKKKGSSQQQLKKHFCVPKLPYGSFSVCIVAL